MGVDRAEENRESEEEREREGKRERSTRSFEGGSARCPSDGGEADVRREGDGARGWRSAQCAARGQAVVGDLLAVSLIRLRAVRAVT